MELLNRDGVTIIRRFHDVAFRPLDSSVLCTNNVAVIIIIVIVVAVVCVVAVFTCALDSLIRFLFEYKKLLVLSFFVS